jgi:hypothetical protein
VLVCAELEDCWFEALVRGADDVRGALDVRAADDRVGVDDCDADRDFDEVGEVSDATSAAWEVRGCLLGLFFTVGEWVVGIVLVLSAGAFGEPPNSRKPAAASRATKVSAAPTTRAVRRPRCASPS